MSAHLGDTTNHDVAQIAELRLHIAKRHLAMNPNDRGNLSEPCIEWYGLLVITPRIFRVIEFQYVQIFLDSIRS